MKKARKFLERSAIGVLAVTMTVGGVPQMALAASGDTVKEYDAEMAVENYDWTAKVTVGLNADKTIAYVKDNGTVVDNAQRQAYWEPNINNATNIFKGKNKEQVEAMAKPDVVSGATYTWKAMKQAVLTAVTEGTADTGNISVPTEELDLSKYYSIRNKYKYVPTVLKVPVNFYNATKDVYSIGNDSVNHVAYVIVGAGTANNASCELKLSLQDMEYMGVQGNVSAVYYFDNKEAMENWKGKKDTSGLKDVLLDSLTKSGLPHQVAFTLPSKEAVTWVATKVPAMGNAVMEVRCGLDYSKAEMLDGKELLEFWVDQFENDMNMDYYTKAWTKRYDSDLFDSKELLTEENPSEASLKLYVTRLAGIYKTKAAFDLKNDVIKQAKTYLDAEQGDFTDASWKFLRDESQEAYDWLNGDECTVKDVVEYNRRLTTALSKLEMKEGCKPYSQRLRELFYDISMLDGKEYRQTTLAMLKKTAETQKNLVTWDNEVSCRTRWNSLTAMYNAQAVPQIKHLGDGEYTLTAKTYTKQEDGTFKETHSFDQWLNLKAIKLKVAEGKHYFEIPTNMSEQFPMMRFNHSSLRWYGDQNAAGVAGSANIIKEFGNRTEYFATTLSINAPDQADRDHFFITGSVRNDQNEKLTIDGNTDQTIYLEMDYANAVKNTEVKVDKSNLKAQLDACGDATEESLVAEGCTETYAKDFMEILTAAKRVYRLGNSTQDEINQYANALANKRSNRETYAGIYKNKVSEIRDILAYTTKRSLYTTESLDELKTVYRTQTAAISALENPTNQDYAAATEALSKARKSLVAKSGSDVDKSVLAGYIKEASALQPDDYTEASYENLLNVLKAAQSLNESADATQSQVDSKSFQLYSAIKGLKEADPNEVRVNGLKTELEAAKAIDGTLYTKESYDALKAAIQSAEDLLAKESFTQKEVDEQKAALKDAMSKLVSVAEKEREALNAKISEAEAKAAETGYTQESYDNLNAVIAAAKKVAADASATADALNAQIDNLSKAIAAMETAPAETLADGIYEIPVGLWKANSDDASIGNGAIAGKGQLRVTNGVGRLYIPLQKMDSFGVAGYLGELNLMKNIEFNSANYPVKYDTEPATVESEFQGYDSFNDPTNGTDQTMRGRQYPSVVSIPVDIAKQDACIWTQLYIPVMNALGKPEQKFGVQEARIHLEWNALKKLQTADKLTLEAKLNEAKGYAADPYTAESYQALQNAIQAAESVMNQTDATQEAVDAQVEALNTAIKALVKKEAPAVKADKTKLVAEIQKAEGLTKDNYTDDSWKAMKEALAAAQAVNEKEAATQEEVDDSTSALSKALDQLKTKDADTDDTDTLADGKYNVEVHLWHASKNQASMGDPALNHTALLEVKDGVYTLTVSGHPITLGKITSNLTSMEIKQADGSYQAAEIVARNIEGGKPSAFRFTLPGKEEFIDVKIDPAVAVLGGAVDARLKIDWASVKKAADDAVVDDNVKNEVIDIDNDGVDNITNGNGNNGSNGSTIGGNGNAGTTGNGGNSQISGDNNGSTISNGKFAGIVKTGDVGNTMQTTAAGAGIVALGAMVAGILRRRKREDDK